MGVHGPRRALLIPHRNNYRAAVLADSPVGYWRLGEASGSSASDSSGNGRTGTLGAGASFGVTGALAAEPDGTSNGAAAFAGGVTSYISVADHASLDLGDTFTLEAWARRTGGAGSYGILVGKPSGGYEMGFNASDQMCIFKAGAAEPAHTAATFGADGIWRHFVVTKSGSTRHIYVNGIEDTVLAADATVADTATDLTIGAEGTLNTFIGRIDEVAVYGTALSAARVQAHYSASGRGR